MEPSFFESSLRRRIAGILAASAPLATALAACGNGNQCQSMCCNMPPPQQYTATYTACPAIGFALDASDDGDAADGGEDAMPPAQCFSDCQQACESQKPYTGVPYGGAVECIGQPEGDGGDGGTLVAQCEVLQLCGRRLDGLLDATRGRGSALGETLARAAWLEAASIHAFRRLARELREHGAPDELVSAARACAHDEARHARAMARLAKRHGAEVPRVEIRDCGVRDLEAIARENAIEACVGETHGALLAEWAAQRATNLEVREAMRAIAPDELRHAALGWAIAAWADSRMSEPARARVRAARDEAARSMLQNASIPPDDAVAGAMGAPSAADAVRFASAMRAEVWT